MEYSHTLLLIFILIPVLASYRFVRIKDDLPAEPIEPEQRNICNYAESVLKQPEVVSDEARQLANERIQRIRELNMGSADQIRNQVFFDNAFFVYLREYAGAMYFLQQSNKIARNEDSIHVIKNLTLEIKINPLMDSNYVKRGLAFMRIGLYKKALQDFSKAIELNDKNSSHYYFRGFVWKALGERGMAYFDWLHASQMGDEWARRMIGK
jgi:tetratricopeptide (TPR) repeat protein